MNLDQDILDKFYSIGMDTSITDINKYSPFILIGRKGAVFTDQGVYS